MRKSGKLQRARQGRIGPGVGAAGRHTAFRLRLGWLAAALGWAAVLALLATGDESGEWFWRVFAELRYSGLSWPLLGGLAGTVVWRVLEFVPLGVFATLAFEAGRRGWTGRLATIFAGLASAFLLAWLVAGVHAGGAWLVPGLVELGLPILGCVVGVALAGAFRLPPGRWAPSLAWRVAALAVAGALAVMLAWTAVVSDAPAPVPKAEISTEERRALVERFRRANPLRVPPGSNVVLSLSPAELQALLSWAAILADPDARAAVRDAGDELAWRASLGMPRRFGGAGHVSAGGALAFAGDGESLRVTRCRLSVGSLQFRHWSCAGLLRSVHHWVFASEEHRALVASVTGFSVDAEGLRAEYGRLALDASSRARLQQALGPGWEVRAAARAQFAMLRANGPALAADEDRFAAVLRAAFALAAERSFEADGAVAVQENQGAILALATVLGHPDVATIAGLERPADWREMRAALWPVQLRGRADWTQHFLVSAALTQLATATISDAAGLLKEELDAAGQSGFSFGDLLADRAGTVFGEAAARDERAARALQDWVVNSYDTAGLMPPGHDLPEGISDAALNSRYGGVGGPGYLALEADIEARVQGLFTWGLLE